MLKTVEISRAKKTAGVAVTYRAGSGEKYATCPASCKMNCSGKGAAKLDAEYLDALLDAVPRKGVSFTYSHFDPLVYGWGTKLKEGKTVINFSTENPNAAAASIYNGVPSVVVVAPDYWQGRKTQEARYSVQVVRCPAEYREGFSCRDCGNGLPLCARLDRDYIIGFTAHGPNKKKAADVNTRGGCYADAGNCRIWWNQTADGQQDETDAEKVRRFAKSLPPRSIIRHHVAGDIGKE
jgi:hypothetical protein